MTSATSWITRRPHPDGSEACIRDTNINVWGLIERRRLGWSDERILASVQGLKPEDIEVALEYAAKHRDEIDEFIRRNREA
jgi:uncharacterized protein (DUF433 family)